MGIEELLAGHRLCDRYRVDAVIGRGGMGIVYRATDIRLEREVAVKVITAASADVAARARLRERFQREARAIARIQHPNVVGVYDFGSDPKLDLDFLVLELLRGEDLATRLARTARLPVQLSTEILRQAARGLAAGHEAGIIHRDVKPGNLFLTRAEGGRLRVALLDFGIVQLAADPAPGQTMTHLTVFGRAPHSPAYAAPEQLRGDPELTPACDVWALAVTGYQMLTGEKPFPDTVYAVLANGGRVDPPSARDRNPAVPEELDSILQAALSPVPAERFRDARAFGTALENAYGHADAAFPAPAVAARQSPLEPDPTRAEDDHTLLVEPAATAASRPHLWEPAGVDRPHGPGWLRRTGNAIWSLAVTTGAAALAAAFGYAFFISYEQSHTEPFYASLIGMSIALPWAIHRFLGRRGSFFLALLGSVATAVVALRLVAPVASLDTTVMLLPIGQVVASAWLLRLTRRVKAPEPLPGERWEPGSYAG